MTRAETFEELVSRLTPDETWGDFADRARVTSRQLLNLRNGVGKRAPTAGTVALLALALDVDEDVVRAAIEASRAAGEG